ncbi:hypothetical protein H5T54_07440 [Candidatus Bipolaricaulota bacterium]|nr:hypothetical protein [Candidatus Bipolaricaulota bacterium]
MLGILGKVDFSERWELVGRLAIAWGAVVLVGIPFDIVIYALEGRLKRKKAEQQANRGSET